MVDKRPWPERFRRFERRQRIVVGVLTFLVIFVTVGGAWQYGIGVALGFLMGWFHASARGHMELAKAHLETADLLDEVDKNTRSAMATVLDAAFEEGKQQGKKMGSGG